MLTVDMINYTLERKTSVKCECRWEEWNLTAPDSHESMRVHNQGGLTV